MGLDGWQWVAAIGIVVFATLILASLIIGAVREVLIAKYTGVSPYVDEKPEESRPA